MSLFKYLDTLTPKVYILQLGNLVLAKVGYTSKDIKATVGEVRWNVFNGVPTLYLAISAHADPTGSAGTDAKEWAGIPLFGDIVDFPD